MSCTVRDVAAANTAVSLIDSLMRVAVPAWFTMALRIFSVERWTVEIPSRIVLIAAMRSEEHTSELQSLMRISYAVFCLKKKKIRNNNSRYNTNISQIIIS